MSEGRTARLPASLIVCHLALSLQLCELSVWRGRQDNVAMNSYWIIKTSKLNINTQFHLKAPAIQNWDNTPRIQVIICLTTQHSTRGFMWCLFHIQSRSSTAIKLCLIDMPIMKIPQTIIFLLKCEFINNNVKQILLHDLQIIKVPQRFKLFRMSIEKYPTLVLGFHTMRSGKPLR